MLPSISVVVPTRDRLESLARCLAALAPEVQALSRAEYEVIVSDDARSEALASVLAERFPWARWTAGPGAGPAANRNHGARQARGRWLVFTDDDCIPAPGWLAAYARAFAGGKKAFEGRVVSDPGPRSAWDEAPVNPHGGCFWTCNVAVERAAFEACGGFDENYPYAAMEDVDLRTALERRGYAIAFLEDALVNHPARTSGVGRRLRSMRNFFAYAYYRRKWQGPHPVAHYLDIARVLARFWGWTPLRRGSALLAGLFPVVLVYVTARFPGWYRRADRLVKAAGLRRA